MTIDEEQYGVEVADAAVLACSFTTSGLASHRGVFEPLSSGCAHPLTRWAQIERAWHPKVVVIEMGHRDQFNWRWGQRIVHLGQPQFDAQLEQHMESFVTQLARGGTQILFLSVPISKFDPLPNGKPAPESDPARHRELNAIIRHVATRHPGVVTFLDIDRFVSPGGRFHRRIGGHLCRFDGVHFAMYCSQVLRDPVLSTVRKMSSSPVSP